MDASPQNNYGYNKKLQPVANKLRKQMTKAEACIWKYILRAGQMKGYQFRRQRPVLNYVADFMCKELMLVIEMDGITHGETGAQERDAIRQRAIEATGFTVLRFKDNDMLRNKKGVYDAISNWIIAYEQLHPDVKPSHKYLEE